MSACPRCETRFSGGAKLCRNCGAPLPPPDPEDLPPPIEIVPPDVGARVCASCGRCVPAKLSRCAMCASPATPRIVPPRPDGAYWARVACEYRCAGCATYVPLTGFTAEGRSRCGACAHIQDQPPMFWRVVLKHAHAVADLAGPSAEGRNGRAGVSIGAANPYKVVGLETADLADDGGREADDTPRNLIAGPGYPPCAGCGAAVDPAWTGGALSCTRCGVLGLGALPGVAAKVNRSLRALLGSADATRPATEGVGAVALTCPTCRGPLTVTEGARQATCKYCQGTSLVVRPAEAHARAPAEGACWMLFVGSSRTRSDLEAKVAAGTG